MPQEVAIKCILYLLTNKKLKFKLDFFHSEAFLSQVCNIVLSHLYDFHNFTHMKNYQMILL